MTQETMPSGRQIVTCDDCGNPYAAVVDEDDLLLVGDGDAECSDCGGSEFSRLSI